MAKNETGQVILPEVQTLLDFMNDSWNAVQPFRNKWDEKEYALLAQTADSISGNVAKGRVTDAALSTLAYERQARIAAQLPTGKVYPAGKADEGKAKLADLALHRYIVPNADSQFPMLVKQRLWGVYSSVYGSMPMFYDYRVDDQYIGPDCWLVDPRMYYPQAGRNSVQEMDKAGVSTISSIEWVKSTAKKKNTSWSKPNLNKLADMVQKGHPSRTDDSQKDSVVQRQRYDSSLAEGQVELLTIYENGVDGHWKTIAPDFPEAGILRDIPNPHKSGKIPIVMRHCFPLMNSIYGLGDFERGMKIQKAKDSLTNLFLEGSKNRVFPPVKMDITKVTPSTIKLQAGSKWSVRDMNAVAPVDLGQNAQREYQGAYGLLQGMLMNQFGTTDTSLNQDNTGNPTFGKTPEALKQLSQRENARDTWDMFMHEQAVNELYEGMINLLSVKMEKPVNFLVFEQEVKELKDEYGDGILDVFANQKMGQMTITKKDMNPKSAFTYVVDAGSSNQKDDQATLQALGDTWKIAHESTTLGESLQAQGMSYNEAEHFKSILTASGLKNWNKILEGYHTKTMPKEAVQAQAQAEAKQQFQPQGPPQGQVPDYNNAPPTVKAQMEQAAGFQPGIEHGIQASQPANVPQFDDPQIQALAQQIAGGQNG